jgi:hypothetical protein
MPWGSDSVGASSPGPKRARVIASFPGVTPLRSERRATRINDIGIDATDLIDVDSKSTTCVGKKVRQEYIGTLHDLHEHPKPIRTIERQPDTTFTAIGVLHHRNERADAPPPDLGPSEAALTVPPLRMLDFDDRGTPIR